jgi:histidine phosphotransferase ChpT
LSGPIAAIGNGTELLAEEDQDFAREAVELIGDSARRAGRRLQFYRFAYGFGPTASLAGPMPHELATGFFNATRIACDYALEARSLPLDRQKLGCNLLVLGAEALPRGGQLRLTAGSPGPELEVVGDTAAITPDVLDALQLEIPVGAITSRTIQAYFTGLLARALGCRLIRGRTVAGRFQLSAIVGAA